MADEEFEGVPVGLGLAGEAAGPEGIVAAAAMQAAAKKGAKAEKKEEKREEKREQREEKREAKIEARAEPKGQGARKTISWLWGKFSGEGDPAVTNLNFMGIVAILILAYQALSWITGFRPDFRIFGMFFIFVLFLMIRTNIFAAFGWALADFVIPSFLISLITQNVPSYFQVLTPIINSLPLLPSAVQNSLIVLVIIFSPSLDFVFFVKRVGETEKPRTTIYGFAKLLQLLFIFWFIVGFALSLGAIGFNVLQPIANMATLTSEGRAALSDAGRWALNSPTMIANGLTSLYKQQINIATAGEYYQGEQATPATPVGVKVEMQKPNILYSGQPAVVWAQITALSLPEKSLDITTVCLSDDPKKGFVSGKTFPAQFTIDIAGRTEAVRCSFDSLQSGNRIINFTATFNAVTSSQLPVTFIDRERLLSEQTQIPTINRLSESSAGPVKFNIGLQSPVALSTKPPYPWVGITIEPVGRGSITNLKKFIINVPQGIELVECDRPVVATSEDQRPGYSAYALSDTTGIVTDLGQNPFQSFGCFMKTNNPQNVLKGQKTEAGQSADRYIFVYGEYDFQWIASQTVNVQKGAAETSAATSASSQGTAAGSQAGSQAGTAASQQTSAAVVCLSFDGNNGGCMSAQESGKNCVYLSEKSSEDRCRMCDSSLCCATPDRFAGIPANEANIKSRCGIDCATVSCVNG